MITIKEHYCEIGYLLKTFVNSACFPFWSKAETGRSKPAPIRKLTMKINRRKFLNVMIGGSAYADLPIQPAGGKGIKVGSDLKGNFNVV